MEEEETIRADGRTPGWEGGKVLSGLQARREGQERDEEVKRWRAKGGGGGACGAPHPCSAPSLAGLEERGRRGRRRGWELWKSGAATPASVSGPPPLLPRVRVRQPPSSHGWKRSRDVSRLHQPGRSGAELLEDLVSGASSPGKATGCRLGGSATPHPPPPRCHCLSSLLVYCKGHL